MRGNDLAPLQAWHVCGPKPRNGDGRVARSSANHLGNEDGYVCFVTHSGTAQEVAAPRRRWIEFRLALLELGKAFRDCANLSAFDVTNKIP